MEKLIRLIQPIKEYTSIRLCLMKQEKHVLLNQFNQLSSRQVFN